MEQNIGIELYPKKHHSCHYSLEKICKSSNYVTNIGTGFIFPRIAYLIKGECTITLPDGKSLDFKENDVWFIPKNKPYISSWRKNDVIEFYAIEFDADFLSELYTDFKIIKGTNALPLFDNLFESRKSNNFIAELKYFYAILDIILPSLKRAETLSTDSILPALNYLNANYSTNVKVEDLAKMCHMAQSTFYKTFKAITKTSPIEYKNAIKLTSAFTLIKKGFTLEQICEELNFTSPAFLRRLLKKFYKKTPTEIKNEQNFL